MRYDGRMRGLGFLAVVLAACATPYGAMGFTGGVELHRIGPNTFVAQVRVNSYTSSGTALEYAYRAAGEQCPRGFDPVDRSTGQTDLFMRTGSTVQNMPKSNVALVFQCKTPRVVEQVVAPGASDQPVATAEPIRKTIYGNQPLFCIGMVEDTTVGSCWVNAEMCGAEYERRTAGGVKYESCEAKTAGACFSSTVVLDGTRRTVCSPSIRDCEHQLGQAKTDPDLTALNTACAIYRVKT